MIKSIKTKCSFLLLILGYRSVPLLNQHSEDIPLASLLINIKISNASVRILLSDLNNICVYSLLN